MSEDDWNYAVSPDRKRVYRIHKERPPEKAYLGDFVGLEETIEKPRVTRWDCKCGMKLEIRYCDSVLHIQTVDRAE